MKRLIIIIGISTLIAVVTAFYFTLPMKTPVVATDKIISEADEKHKEENDHSDIAGPFRISVSIDPTTPKVGKNEVTIVINDERGKPISNATIKAVSIMPSMGSMPAMFAPAELEEIEPGKYQGQYQPSMAGEWPMTIEINATAGRGKITYDLATGREGIRCASCGSGAMEVPGTIHVDPGRRQLIGITTGKVRLKKLTVPIRAAGRISYDETRLTDISLKFDGWIGELSANALGKTINKGDVLFTVYGPDLLAAQEEYLVTRRRISATSSKNQRLLDAARRRLRLWSLSKQQIKQLEKRDHALEYVPILSPVSGTIISKSVVKGSAIKQGQRLFRIADLSQVWVEADIYDADLALLKLGMKVKIKFHEMNDHVVKTRIDYIYPYMENQTRTGKIRLILDNPNGLYRPNMFVQVAIRAKLGKRLLVPESAVLYAGETRLVFLDLGDGRLQPRKIKTGQRNRRWIEVLDGLEKGDKVITSGNFLIASESKLKSGIQQW